MNNANIEIIIPIYNAEKYLSRCLDSVFNQDYTSFHVICVNDGSIDNSQSILDEYKKKYIDKIHIINKENGGPSTARNVGLDYVFEKCGDCKYITFVDADDYVDTNYLSTLVKLLEKHDVDIVCTSFMFSKINGEHKYHQIYDDTKYDRIQALNILLEDRTVQSHSHCKLYKKETWNKVRFPVDIVAMEDQATIYKTFINSSYVLISDYTGYHYWQDGTSIMRSKMSNKKVIDSILGYMTSLKDQNLPKECYESSIQGFSACYLMMFPRFNSKDDNFFLSDILVSIQSFVYKNKIILNYKPKCTNDKIKKRVYLFSAFIYKKMYRLLV